MAKTVFQTPLVSQALRVLFRTGLRLAGWRVEGSLPAGLHKYVLIGAPHTSNWDFILMLAAVFDRHLNVNWMGKDALFRGPMGPVMRWLGGIAIDRSHPHGLVAQMVDTYNNSAERVLVIPPEGTRKKVERWKTGFYWIAAGAHVPIVLGYADFGRKVVGFGPVFEPSGDIGQDMPRIQAFYNDKQARYPALF